MDAERGRIQTAVEQICDGELATLAAQLEALGQNDDARQLTAQLDSAQAVLCQAQRELTRLAHGVGPAELTQLGLARAVTAAAHRLSPNIIVSVTSEPLTAGIQAAAYFVLCELMTNAVKHAGDSATEVKATLEGSALVLEVTDTGPGGADPNGSGLRGLAERVASLSGSLTVSSAPESGTRATVRLPVPLLVPSVNDQGTGS